MRRGRVLVWFTIFAVGLTVVLSGPLVAGVDFTHPPPGPTAPIGVGTANVSVQTVPDTVVLERSSFGAETYHFAQEESVVTVSSVTRNPYLEYRIEIPRLDIVHIRGEALHGAVPRKETLRFDAYEIRPGLIRNDTYRGRLLIQLQSDNYAVLHSSNITIEVKN